MVNGWFDELAGKGDYINPEIPAQDMEDLRGETAVVRGWVNKAIAHKDATGRNPPPLTEIHSCIDVIFELFNKYGQLIRGVSTSSYVPRNSAGTSVQAVIGPEPGLSDDGSSDVNVTT